MVSDALRLYRGNGFYPGTGDVQDVGKDEGRGFNLNIPFPRGGFNDADYIAAFDLVCACSNFVLSISTAVHRTPLGSGAPSMALIRNCVLDLHSTLLI